MNSYAEDYQMSTPEEKLALLQSIYNNSKLTRVEKEMIVREAQRLHIQLRNTIRRTA